MATESQHSETMSGAPASSEPADVGANAALILAALGRIEAVVRDERAAMASLRSSGQTFSSPLSVFRTRTTWGWKRQE